MNKKTNKKRKKKERKKKKKIWAADRALSIFSLFGIPGCEFWPVSWDAIWKHTFPLQNQTFEAIFKEKSRRAEHNHLFSRLRAASQKKKRKKGKKQIFGKHKQTKKNEQKKSGRESGAIDFFVFRYTGERILDSWLRAFPLQNQMFDANFGQLAGKRAENTYFPF